MVVPVEFFLSARNSRGAPFPAQLEQGNGCEPASAVAAVCLGSGHPGVLHSGKRFAPGILQFWSMAGDFLVAGAWHSACRRDRSGMAETRPESLGRAGSVVRSGRRILSLDFDAD